MKMYSTILAAALLLSNLQVQAQTILKGIVADSARQAVTGAEVGLYKKGITQATQKTITSMDGQFTFSTLKPGGYTLTVKGMGYQPIQREINLDMNQTLDLGSIILKQSTTGLKEVTITATVPMVEHKDGRTVLNVASSIAASGGTALDALQNLPGVKVDQDGLISVKGKQGVLVMLDGKQTYLSPAELSNFLNGMPASQIETIDLTTNPSAKYDAAGSSGIINIKTKRLKVEQFAMNNTLGLGYGFNPKVNLSNTISIKKGKWNTTTSASLNYNQRYMKNESFREWANGLSLTQNRNAEPVLNSQSIKLNTSYAISANQSIGIGVSANFNKMENDMQVDYITRNSSNPVSRIEYGQNSMNRNTSIYKLNGSYNLKIDSASDLTFNADLITNKLDAMDIITVQQGNRATNTDYNRLAENNRTNIAAFQTDYVLRINKKVSLEAGAKFSKINYAVGNEQFNRTNDTDWKKIESLTSNYNYSEVINAAYLKYNTEVNKWSFNAGLRIENTQSKGEPANSQKFTRVYTNLFPSGFIKYAVSKNTDLSLSYSRRLNRPNYQDLNPAISSMDKYTTWSGNSRLKPDISDVLELNLSVPSGINFTMSYGITHDMIGHVPQNLPNGTFAITPQNINSNNSASFSMNKTFRVNNKLSVTNTAGIDYAMYDVFYTSGSVKKELYSWDYSGTLNYQITKNLRSEVTLTSYSDVLYMMGRRKGQTYIDLGLQQSILKNKASLKLSVSDVFNNRSMVMNMNAVNVLSNRVNGQFENRIANLSFSWNIGKSKNGMSKSPSGKKPENGMGKKPGLEEESRLGGQKE